MKKEVLIGLGVFLVVVSGLMAFFWKDIKTFFAKKTTKSETDGSTADTSNTAKDKADASTVDNSDPLLNLGSKGEYVKMLQNRMNEYTHSDLYPLVVDGNFESSTEQRLTFLTGRYSIRLSDLEDAMRAETKRKNNTIVKGRDTNGIISVRNGDSMMKDDPNTGGKKGKVNMGSKGGAIKR